MKLLQRTQRLAAWLARAAWLILGRQPMTIVSAFVLVALAVLVLTSDSFESREGETGSAAERPLLVPDATPAHRPSVLFYVVNDAAQRDEIAAAIQSDRQAFADGAGPNDLVVYLLAGTKEDEERTIARLNFEEAAARASHVDMRVIDLRGRFD